MSDQQTINVYDNQTDEYAELVRPSATSPELLEFIALIKPGGYVLDLGCGPAMDSACMRDHGLTVDPVDASSEMVKLANSKYAIGARTARFDEIASTDTYDGVWANFSLLHASAEDFPKILDALHTATRAGGWIHLAMKLGTGSKRDFAGTILYLLFGNRTFGCSASCWFHHRKCPHRSWQGPGRRCRAMDYDERLC